MKFEQLRKIEERFDKAGDYLDNTIAALQKDIELNPTMSAEEMKFNLSGVLMNVTNIATLLDVTAEAVHRLAMMPPNLLENPAFDTSGEGWEVPVACSGKDCDHEYHLAHGGEEKMNAYESLTGPNRSDSIDSETTEGGEPK